tara:strand:+ start:25234 stop:27060 length:1827 start_codon:yes stop_codon:yes gene_type:complete
MCGFVGYIGPELPSIELLRNASNSIKHRGPDGQGFYTHQLAEQSIALVHRRLAIIDLDSRSDQPFRVGNYILVYNGEIYNYIEIRKELKNLGYSFKTDGDTEVLAIALKHWGTNALNKLEGMWSFAWYNEQNGELILCRDRFGEKPLYYWRFDNGIYFGSEIKALAAIAGREPEINENHLIRYLVNGYKSLYKTKDTFHVGVEELPVSSYLKFSERSRDEQSFIYWSPKVDLQEDMTYQQAVKKSRDALIHAVSLRMRSDVPIAFCMSGGIDSNSLLSIAKRELGLDVHGFTIVNTDSRYEENDLVNESVKELDIEHTFLKPSHEGFLENMYKLVSSHDAPVCTISYYMHWRLMESVAKQGYKVSVSGTGADELFTGYYDHHNLYLSEVSKNKLLYQESLDAWLKHQKPIVRNPYLQDPNLFIKSPSFRKHIYLNNEIFAKYLKFEWNEDFIENDYKSGLLRNRMLNELFVEGTRIILKEDDLNAMSFSIENRSPFLDKNLFQTAYSIPTEHLIKNGFAKSVLRDSMRGIVPDKVLDNRVKVGFNAPILDLLNLNDPDVIKFLLDDSRIFSIVKKEKIKEVLKQNHMTNSFSKFLFSFVNAKIFLDTH